MNPVDPESLIPNPQTLIPDLDGIYVPSFDIVAREIEGELIIVPLTAGVGNLEDELYSMNDTGREVWRLLDGVHTLAQIAVALAEEFDAPLDQIQADVLGLVAELLNRRMIVAA